MRNPGEAVILTGILTSNDIWGIAMGTVNLTATRIDRFKFDCEGPAIQRLWDSEIGGLGVQVVKTGRKSWIFRYRIHGKQRLITICPVSDKSLPDVRELCISYRNHIREGIDPKIQRDAPLDSLTLKQLYQNYTSSRYFKTRSEDFKSNLKSTYNKYLDPELGDYPLSSIQRSQIRKLVDRLIDSGKEGAAKGLLNRTRILLSYAVQQDLVDFSPADHIRPKYTTKGRRTDWLDTPDKLKEAWWFAGAPQARALIRWALLTGCRRDEARTTKYSQVADVWTVPDTKNNRDLVLPVMPAMLDVANEMRQTFGPTAWLFPATTDTHKPIPRGSLDYMVRHGAKSGWSMHTLRHTVETMLRELEVPEETRDLILNHVRASSGDRYSHGAALEMKRKGLEKWHQHLLNVVSENPIDNVLEMKRGK